MFHLSKMRYRFWASCFVVLSPHYYVLAAPLPVPSGSGGIIDRQLESEYESKPLDPNKAAPDIDVDMPDKELTVPEGQKIDVKKIEVFGNTLISSHELSKITAHHQDTKMSMKDILEFCRDIQRIYTEKGYFLVRVFPRSSL